MLKKKHIWPTEPRKKIYIVPSWPPFVSISGHNLPLFPIPSPSLCPTLNQNTSGFRMEGNSLEGLKLFLSLRLTFAHTFPAYCRHIHSLIGNTGQDGLFIFTFGSPPPRQLPALSFCFVFIHLYLWCIATSIWAGFPICNCLTVINSFSFSWCSALQLTLSVFLSTCSRVTLS